MSRIVARRSATDRNAPAMRIETRIGDDLLERPVDRDQLEEAIEGERDDLAALRDRLRESPNELDRTRLGRVLNRLGVHLKLAGEYDEACDCLEEAVEIWEEFDRRRAAYLARIRATAVEMCRDRLETAEARADELVEAGAEAPFEIYRDFALELRGRIRARRGDVEGGRRDLRESLDLRRDADRDRLAERTATLLEHIESPEGD